MLSLPISLLRMKPYSVKDALEARKGELYA